MKHPPVRDEKGSFRKVFCDCNDSWSFAHWHMVNCLSYYGYPVFSNCKDCGFVPWVYKNKEDEPK